MGTVILVFTFSGSFKANPGCNVRWLGKRSGMSAFVKTSVLDLQGEDILSIEFETKIDTALISHH